MKSCPYEVIIKAVPGRIIVSPIPGNTEYRTKSERKIFHFLQMEFRKRGYKVGPVYPLPGKPETAPPLYGGLVFDITSPKGWRGYVIDPYYQIVNPADELRKGSEVVFRSEAIEIAD